ncbi:MAG TPA: 4-alpha-glucanotransferase [Thermoanaerobaculia bacterium]|nr:4-alpha-glucanotransferase [Thermoanaerobaculia bacterium]
MHTSAHPSPDGARAAGILLHPTSLPGRYGVGELGDDVVLFLDWAAAAGMKVWQVLPLNPPGYGYSPYGCLSSFAGNPLLISPQRLLHDGLLEAADVENVPQFSDEHAEFSRAEEYKLGLLRTSLRRFLAREAADPLRRAFETFVAAPEQSEWLDAYALFMTIKERSGGEPWWEWDRPLAARDAAALETVRRESAEEIRFWQYLQFLFFRQWAVVRDAAHARGIRIMGDVPIYVAGDSADVWASPSLFQLDESGEPTVVAGVPPDYFSTTGQRWGNPLYRWEPMRESGYRWWVSRIRTNLRFADIIRLDHFRGFAAYWEIPASEPTAIHGRWMPGPGLPLFEAIRAALGELPLVAEDLGFITQDVHDLRRAIGVPGMKIIQFGFGQNDNIHLPHRYEPHTVAYTGTHDNDTARGWFDHASDVERENALRYLGVTHADDVAWGLVRAIYTSVAETAIVPAQDVLGLGSEARMNTPGEDENNWSWRVGAGALTSEHAERLRKLAVLTGR